MTPSVLVFCPQSCPADWMQQAVSKLQLQEEEVMTISDCIWSRPDLVSAIW